LNTAIALAPRGPNGARLIVNAAVPAYDDHQRRLPEPQAKRHDQRAVDDVLDVEQRAGPHQAQVERLAAPVGVRDVVDPASLERGLVVDRATDRRRRDPRLKRDAAHGFLLDERAGLPAIAVCPDRQPIYMCRWPNGDVPQAISAVT
jgi:hypothetical protein